MALHTPHRGFHILVQFFVVSFQGHELLPDYKFSIFCSKIHTVHVKFILGKLVRAFGAKRPGIME